MTVFIKKKYRAVYSALLCGVVAFAPAYAQDQGPWGEPHLNIVPRTEDEQSRISGATRPAQDFSEPEQFETHPAGAATRFGIDTADAFSFSSANMAFEDELNFKVGNGFFRRLWVSAPASTQSADGLGPIFNARACQSCHIKDGRGHPPVGDAATDVSMFLRLAIPGTPEEKQALIGDPIYGTQLQDKSVAGVNAEGRMGIEYTEEPVTLADGTVVSLRRPSYSFEDPAYGDPHADILLSPRVSPPMIGLGLLEAIPEQDILALADPTDANNDGISGRANRVWSTEYEQWMLGRFGLKAGMPTIREQSAGAFSGDVGLSTSIFPGSRGDCTEAQTSCQNAAIGEDEDGLEVSDEVLDLVTFYARNLAPPARRGLDTDQVLEGKSVFYGVGCADCHTPKFVTHRLEGESPQSFQLIWPYTDMLLHDMGPGLADGMQEWRATGQEWRTPPLWGLGHVKEISGIETYLHDGRARSLLEAVLWHGGEAQPSRDAVIALDTELRDSLIAFLESL